MKFGLLKGRKKVCNLVESFYRKLGILERGLKRPEMMDSGQKVLLERSRQLIHMIIAHTSRSGLANRSLRLVEPLQRRSTSLLEELGPPGKIIEATIPPTYL